MSEEWKNCYLGDIITLQRGFDLPQRDRQSGDIPIVSSSGITGYHTIAKVQGPGVVTGRSGTLGEVFYIKRSFWPLNTTLYVRDFKRNNPLFVSYFLRTLNLAHQNAAGAVPSLNRNALHLLSVRRPPLPTQRTIASILSAYDDLIENNTRRIAVLEEMAQMIYEEWFVKFRFPGHEAVQMIESEMGMIPEGWNIEELGDALTLQRGFDLPATQRRIGDVPVYAATGINGMHDEVRVKGPGVLTGRSGSIGTVMYVKEDFWPLNTTLWVKNFSKVTPIYAFHLLNTLPLSSLNSGAAVPTLNRNDVHKIPIVVPSQNIIYQFDEYISPIFNLKGYLVRKNANLHHTRDLLLPKLISGEIDVSSWSGENADEAIEELAASAIGSSNGHEVRTDAMRGRRGRVAESGPIEPMEKDALEWRSLWDG